MNDYQHLPEHLPVPLDDGACDHLPGLSLPDLALPSTQGGLQSLAQLPGWLVLYCYPMTGVPGVALPQGWDMIPGARGCTPQSCSFRDHHQALRQRGAHVFGISTQSTDYQLEAAQRLHLPFALLSDAAGTLTQALDLPTLQLDGLSLLKRLTLLVRDGVIQHVHYPVFPADGSARYALQWLDQHA